MNETIKTGSQALNEDRLLSYWEIGRRLKRDHADGRVVIARIARGLKITGALLYRAHHFHRTWPDGLTPEAKRLAWRLHQLINGISSPRERDYYVRLALTRGLNDKKLAAEIKNNSFAADSRNNSGDDVGLARDPDPLHVYKAYVDNVVDGDTLDVRIDVGFEILTTRRVRLRGVNASELAHANRPSGDAERAAKARDFVREKLASVPFIVLKTYKTDIYGRFVADVFFHPRLLDKRDVALKGFYLNAELLREGLAERLLY